MHVLYAKKSDVGHDILAFTLLELSIVLVIIGLIVGGITVGADMIRAAEIRSVVTGIQRYHTAIMTFKGKYFALPGDMKNATKFWGAAHSDPATCKTTESTGKETCDGDGDGIVEYSVTGSYEYLRLWQHLANAGMIEGQYIGTYASTGNKYEPGVVLPASKVPNVVFFIDYTTSWWGSPPGHIIMIGGTHSGGTQPPWEGAFTPEETWSMDKKIDDGIGGQGKFRAMYGISYGPIGDAKCVDSNQDYNLASTETACHAKYFWHK